MISVSNSETFKHMINGCLVTETLGWAAISLSKGRLRERNSRRHIGDT